MPETERKAPKLNNLPKLRDRILKGMAAVDNAREDMKEHYAQAKDQNFHIKALKLTIRLWNMEPAERNDFLSSLNAYCDALGITGNADLLGDTPKTPQPFAEAELDDPAGAGSPSWNGGRLAALDGKPADDNPWVSDDYRHRGWAAGHAAGTQLIADGLVDPPPTPKASRRTSVAAAQ